MAEQDDDLRKLLRGLFEVCEDTENIEPKNDFERGRVFEAKRIRRGIGTWFQDEFCGRTHMGEPVNQSREAAMAVLARDGAGTPTVWCDPEIADLVGALNRAGIHTIASCSGHGERDGSILLKDGRELVIRTPGVGGNDAS